MFSSYFVYAKSRKEGGRLEIVRVCFSRHFGMSFFDSQEQSHLVIFGRKPDLDYRNKVLTTYIDFSPVVTVVLHEKMRILGFYGGSFRIVTWAAFSELIQIMLSQL